MRVWETNAPEIEKPVFMTSKQRVGVTSMVTTRSGRVIGCYQDSQIRFFQYENDGNKMDVSEEDANGSSQTENNNKMLKEEHVLDAGMHEAWSIGIDSTDSVIAGGTQSGNINMWNISTYEKTSTIEDTGSFVLAVQFNNAITASHISAANIEGGVTIFDVETKSSVYQLNAHSLPARSLCYSSDDRLLYTASDDRHVSVYDTKSNQIINTFSHGGKALSVDASLDKRHFVVGSSDGLVTLWDLGMQRSMSTYSTHSDQIWGVAYNAHDQSGKRFASVGDDSVIQFYH
jgi:WD repeat-containing protein 61